MICRMEQLLKEDFVAHNKLSPITKSETTDITLSTKERHFEIADINKELTLVSLGIAKYDNPNELLVHIVNYDKFVSAFKYKEGTITAEKRCDAIIYTEKTKEYFLLNELKEKKMPTEKRRLKVRKGAIEQLKKSLETICNVKTIKDYINPFTTRCCCYFNKYAMPPSPSINAITAFNPLKDLTNKVPDEGIEKMGFELREYTGKQTFTLKAKANSLSSIADSLYHLPTNEARELSRIIETDYGIKP